MPLQSQSLPYLPRQRVGDTVSQDPYNHSSHYDYYDPYCPLCGGNAYGQFWDPRPAPELETPPKPPPDDEAP